MKYTQLNTITCYSFSKSIIKPETFCSKAKELGYSSLGIADDNIYCYPSFAKECAKNDLKPVFGYRIKISSPQTHPLDAVLYIKNEEGYLNLLKIIKNKKNTYGLDDFINNHHGLILIFETENSDYCEKLFQDLISPLILKYKKLFEDDLYLGITLNTLKDQQEVDNIYKFADTTYTKTIAFPSVKYLKKNDAYSLYLYSKSFAKEVVEEEITEGPNFLLSTVSLTKIYRQNDLLEAEKLVENIKFDFFKKRGQLIHFENDDDILKEKAFDGLKRKLNVAVIDENYTSRLNYELKVISDMKFSSYFLLVSDYINYAKNNDIKVGPGRGSAGGSLVAYSLNITELDPIRYKLSFERFLNPKRQTMPDIDIDFEDTKRSEIIQYLKKRYGENRVVDIITFSTLKPRSVLNFVGPALSFNQNRLKKLTSSISPTSSTFAEALNDKFYGYRFKKLLEDSYYKDLVAKATPLISLPINTSIHASGIIVNNDPIYLTSPLSEGEKGTTSFEYPYMEEMGYLKVDILGLSNLSFIRMIENEIKKNNKTIPNIQDVLDDEKTFKVLNDLDVTYIFQLESKGMKDTIKTIKPTTFSDIASLIALYRPGPKDYIYLFAERKQDPSKIEYIVDSLKPVLEETYGIMIYQEEVMETLKVVASFSSSDADLFRRAISKKKKDVMLTYKDKFIQGCKNNGIDMQKAETIYSDIEKFSSYGFNKSHAYSYALIVYQLLYYKANYSQEFYKACLKETSLSDEKFISLGTELKKRNYTIKSCNINHSLYDESVFEKDSIYLAFSHISSLNPKFIENIIKERDKNGIYKSFYDFIKRNIKSISNGDKKSINSMIEAGVFDSLYIGRESLKTNLEMYISFIQNGFDEDSIPPFNLDDEDLGERLNQEKYSLGIILSTRLSNIYAKPGYKTLIISDDSGIELNHTIIASSENKEYKINITKNDSYQKNDFILVKADFTKKGFINPLDIINIKKRKVKENVKNLHR